LGDPLQISRGSKRRGAVSERKEPSSRERGGYHGKDRQSDGQKGQRRADNRFVEGIGTAGDGMDGLEEGQTPARLRREMRV